MFVFSEIEINFLWNKLVCLSLYLSHKVPVITPNFWVAATILREYFNLDPI